ncbi:hypothetical protein RM543_04150 [Roseicyclus sp. F158]|uniref:Uncharacterized protein n=1 Tax=Tropicimonas omnivorans TaxID=3075590 RepID=A0ABU3DFG1_9RHOB|nr:hypothetical protein [Roseicyclus sp. F158]MDT0681867.1 hypothetical protein [Roseicyclus sp. F158]
MTRHIVDRTHRARSGQPLTPFAAAGKRLAPEGSHPNVLGVIRRPRVRNAARVARYADIERGRQA